MSNKQQQILGIIAGIIATIIFMVIVAKGIDFKYSTDCGI